MKRNVFVEFILEDILEFHKSLGRLQTMALSSGIRDAGLIEFAVECGILTI